MRLGGFARTGLVVLLAVVAPIGARADSEQAHSHQGYDGHAMPPLASLGGPFSLTDSAGHSVTDQDFRGRFMLLYFGYTRCRVACPISLGTMSETLRLLGDAGARVQPIFVSFDDKRDTRERAGEFARGFHPRILGLTGTRKQVYDIAREYKVRREHTPARNEEKGYRINHTTWIFLVGPDGKVRDIFYHSIHPKQLAKQIRAHLDASTGDGSASASAASP